MSFWIGFPSSTTLHINQHPAIFAAQDVYVIRALFGSWKKSRYHPSSKQKNRPRIHRKYRSSNAGRWLGH
jgi:hypothetical protein